MILQQVNLVSIIIPVYNAEQYLEETILSAIGQVWPNKEIIIVDDGSTDKSLAIAKKYENDIVKVFTQANAGASAARNRGLYESNGSYIQFLDADDIISADKIACQMQMLNGTQDYIALCSTVHFKDGENHLTQPVKNEWYEVGSNDPGDFLIKLYSGHEIMAGYGGMIQPNAWLIPKRIQEKAGGWNEHISVDDDGEFFCRVILASKGIKFSKQGVNYYRKFDDSRSLSAVRNRKGSESKIMAIDLKHEALKKRINTPILDRIFARHYWLTGVSIYPRFKDLSFYCIKKAKQMGYTGNKYQGGPMGHKVAALLGWKIARLFSYYKNGV